MCRTATHLSSSGPSARPASPLRSRQTSQSWARASAPCRWAPNSRVPCSALEHRDCRGWHQLEKLGDAFAEARALWELLSSKRSKNLPHRLTLSCRACACAKPCPALVFVCVHDRTYTCLRRRTRTSSGSAWWTHSGRGGGAHAHPMHPHWGGGVGQEPMRRCCGQRCVEPCEA
jgi:hypothetical protein